MWQMWKSLETSWWLICCLQYRPAWPVWQWWSVEADPGRVSTCSPAVTWQLLGTGIKSSGPLSDLILVPWALGSSWCWTMLGLVWLKCPGWWGHWYHWLALTFLKDLNPIYSLRDLMYWCIHCCQITPQTVQEPWSRSGRRSPRKPSTVSSGEWPDVGSTYGQMGAIHTNEPDYEASWIRL